MILPLLAAFQLAAASQATAKDAVQPVFHGRNGQTIARAVAVSAVAARDSVVIDGKLDEPVWQRAALLTGFSLYQPVDQRPSPDSTEVLVWYTPQAIYFGIRAFEPHGAVRATLADRDRVGNDDNVEIHLDTFREGRRAFIFIVNPLGVQADGTKSEGGGFIPGANLAPGQNDLSPDFRWESKGRLTDYGYEVEIRIPFSSIRYPVATNQRWGLQINRKVQHSGYEETWTPALKGATSFIAQAGELNGLTNLEHGQVIELNPELTNTVNGSPVASPNSGWTYKSNPTLGGNIKWGVGSNFVLNGTVKPDFSQVEADATQIAADQRFALFYPERRPFFVEGSDQFNVPNTLVYTRRIVRPDEALKFTGKVGGADVAVLSAIDQSASPDAGKPLVNIVRINQGFGTQSTAGLLYSERSGGGRDNRMIGGDVRYLFGGKYFAQFQTAISTTNTKAADLAGSLWEAVIDRTGRAFGFHYNVLGVAPGFVADNGFVNRTGFVKPSFSNRVSIFGTPGGWFERYTVFNSINGTWKYADFFNRDGVLEKSFSLNNSFTFRGGWSLSVTPNLANYGFDSAAYVGMRTKSVAGIVTPFVPLGRLNSTVFNVTAATPQFRLFAASVSATQGNDVDFFEAVPVRRQDYSASLDLRPSQQIRLSATYVSSSFTRRSDGAQTLTTRIPRLKAEYQVARPLFLRIIAQYEATVRAPLRDPATGQLLLSSNGDGTFSPSVERRTNALRADFLFSYRPSPGTVLFLGYGNSMTEADPLAFQRLRRVGDGFFVKLSYLFSSLGRAPGT
jgi:hypothetical protein